MRSVPGRLRANQLRLVALRGSFFIFAITALFVLLLLASISVQLAMQSVARASNKQRSSVALNLAESAADSAEAYLRSQGALPAGTTPLDPLGGTQQLATGSYSALIYPSASNPGALQKSYLIIGTGTDATGTRTREVIVQVRAQSFALYSYFTDEETSPVTSGTIWFYARDRLYGPVHSNDQLHISWDSTAADPIFYGTVSSAADSVAWQPQAPRTTRNWRRVLQGGQDALTLGVDEIPLPETSNLQRDSAWGTDFGFPSSTGVYLPTLGSDVSAGIYINGDCQLQFAVDVSSGDQIINITVGGNTTAITVNLDGNQTTVDLPGPGGVTTYSGIPNGAIYSTGNITSLSGTLADNVYSGSEITVRNAWTISTDVAAGKDITITGDLKYQTEPMPNQPMTHPNNLRAACLGVIADNIMMASGCPNNLTIDGVLLSLGSFYYQAWDSIKRNNLNILGGIIQRQRGPVGTFNSNNVHLTGYNKNYRYDTRMGDYPPPFFPTTGQLDVLSWQYK